jgi:hypothetical protein
MPSGAADPWKLTRCITNEVQYSANASSSLF